MKVHSIAMTVSLLLSATAVCAADLPTQAAAAAATSHATPVATTTASSSANTVTDAEIEKQAHAMGLTQKMHNGHVIWCKSDVPLGTKLASYNCVSNGQVAAAARRSTEDKDTVDKMQRNNLTQPPPIEPTTGMPAPH
jgi:hypothetical protein